MPPTLSNVMPSVTFTEGHAAVTLSPSASVTDPDSVDLTGATVVLSSTDLSNGTFTEFGQATGDVLLFSTAGTSITASYDSSTETLTLSGSDSLADYQAVLDSVEFNNTGANPANYGSDPTRIVTWTVNDGNNIGNATETIDITAVNHPPTLSKLTTFTSSTEEHAATTLSPTLSISDPDDLNLVSATVQITGGTFSGDGDVLSANTGGTGITASYDSSSETLTLTGSDTLAHYWQVLDEVTFQTVLENPTDFGSHLLRDVVWTVNDGSGTANGGAQTSTPVTETVLINNVNDPPALTQVTGSAFFTEQGGPIILADAVSVSDPDDLRLSGATIQITGGTFAGDGDVLEAADLDGTAITQSYNSSTETLILSGADTLANYRSALDAVTFDSGENPTDYGSNPTRTLTWTLMDPSGTANGGVNVSTPVTSTVSITAVNNPPTLTNVPTIAQGGFAGQKVTVAPALSVSDPDNLTLAGATVKITGGTFAGDGDVLATTTAGTSITVNYNSSTETLTLAGSDTPAHYSQVLDSVSFISTSADPGNSGSDPSRTLTWVVNDGSTSNNLSTAVTETVVGSPQVVAQASAAFTENGGAVMLLPALSVTDTNLTLGWSTKATLSPGMTNGAADLVGGKLYVFDGLRPGLVSSAISIYDTSTNSWQADATTDAVARELLASAVDSSGRIYLIDGDDSLNGQFNNLTRYDPATDAVSVLASDPVKRFSPAAAIGSDGNLYVFGGSANNNILTTAEKYNPGTNTWSTLAALPQGVYLASAVADGSKIYVLGGSPGNVFTGTPATNDVQIYDTTTNTWTAGAPMPTGVYAAVAELVGGKIVVTGGDSSSVNLTQIYDPTTNRWTMGPAMPIAEGFADQGMTSDGKQMFVVGGAGNSLALQEFSLPGLPSATVALTGTDIANGTFTQFGQATGDVLAANTAGTLITASYNSTTETLTLTGADTLADYESVLDSVSFNNISQNPGNFGSDPTRTVTWTLNDGNAAFGVGTATETINIAAVNNAPTLSGLTAASWTEEGANATVSGSASVSDVDDLNLVSATVALSSADIFNGHFFLTGPATGDVLSANTGGTSITASYNATTEMLTLTGTDSLAHYTQVLDSVTYHGGENPTNYGCDTTRIVTWTLNDGSGTANGGAQLGTTTGTINVINVNDPPTLSNVTPTFSYTEGQAFILPSSPNVSITDPDDLDLVSATVSITGGTFAGDGDLLFAATGATFITASYNSSTETLTLSGTDTLLHYEQALDSVVFSAGENPTDYGSNPTRTLTWTLMDSSGTANGGINVSTPVTSTVNITAVNDPPTLSGVASSVPAGIGQTVTASPALSVSDPDNLTLVGATVRITGGTFAGDGDVLAATTTGTGITANYNSSTETLTLSGTDTLAHYSQVLDSVTFDSTSPNPTNSGFDIRRTLTWVVNDGSASNNLSAAASTTIVIGGAVKNDFNGDGKSDVLWQNTDGTPAIWEINGSSIIGGGGLSNPGGSWHVEASADFNHDGKADIILQNSDDGMPEIWLMNGTSVTSTITPPIPGPSWHVIAAADFNGDGNPDILWQNTDGTVDIWLMNSAVPVGGGVLTLNPGPTWHAIGAGDFNGDGNADILFQNTDGQAVIWEMNGTNVIGGGPLPFNPGASWHAIGVGDFNGDGHADILWQNTDGTPDIWLMNGTNVIGGGVLALNPGATWHAIGTSDFNGDGKADILWQNTDGQPVIWLMNGANVIGGGPLALNPGAGWHANADGPISPDQMGSGAQPPTMHLSSPDTANPVAHGSAPDGLGMPSLAGLGSPAEQTFMQKLFAGAG